MPTNRYDPDTGIFTFDHQMRRRKRTDDDSLRTAIPDFVIGDVVDLGAGDGRYVSHLQQAGVSAWGLDGTPGVFQLTGGLVLESDLTQPIPDRFGADTGLFIEVGEHIPPEYTHQVLENISQLVRERVIVTWAKPGARNRSHKLPVS